MRSSTVCCARMPNLEIAFFSGNFLPAGDALPWRRQERVNASEVEWKALKFACREKTSRSLAAAAFSLNSRNFYEPLLAKIREPSLHDFFFRQLERKSVNQIMPQAGSPCAAGPDLPTLWLRGKE